MFRPFSLLILGIIALIPACENSSRPGRSGADTNTSASATTNLVIYQVKGVVADVTPEKNIVRIKHEAVPGYMGAMTMDFSVRDKKELEGLEAGYPVEFRMLVTDTDGWIDQIRKTGPKTNVLPTSGPVRIVREVEPLAEGDPLPDLTFTNQLGQAFSISQYKGQALAIEFLFTRCPFPTFCPLLANNFGEAQKALAEKAGGPTNWQLLTITFDPEFDTPAVLKNYAEMHRYDPKHWTFATGNLEQITTFGQQFGLAFWRDEPNSLPNHNLRVAVINHDGRVRKIIVGNEWKSEELVDEMVKAAGAGK